MGQRQLEWMTEYQETLERIKEMKAQVERGDEGPQSQGGAGWR